MAGLRECPPIRVQVTYPCPTHPQDIWKAAHFWATTPIANIIHDAVAPMMGAGRLAVAQESTVDQTKEDIKSLVNGTSVTTYATVDGQHYRLKLAQLVENRFCATCFPSFIYDVTYHVAKLYRGDSLIYRASRSSIDGGMAMDGEQYEKHGTELIFARAIAQTLGCKPADQGYIREINIRPGSHFR